MISNALRFIFYINNAALYKSVFLQQIVQLFYNL